MNTEPTLEPETPIATDSDAATSDFDNTDHTTTESQDAAIVVPESDPAPESAPTIKTTDTTPPNVIVASADDLAIDSAAFTAPEPQDSAFEFDSICGGDTTAEPASASDVDSSDNVIVVPESDPAPESLMTPESESSLAIEPGVSGESGDDLTIEPQLPTCESINSSDVLVCVDDDATETLTAPPLALPISSAVEELSPSPVSKGPIMSKGGRVNKRPVVNKRPTLSKASVVSNLPIVSKGGIVNVDFAPDLDAHSLLLGASLAVVRRGGRAAFIEVVPGAVNGPRTPPTSSRHEATDANTPTNVAPTTLAPPFRYLQAHDFGDFITKLCALFNEPVRPDLIAVHGFDFLFQTETPHGKRGVQAKENPLTGLAHLRHWLGAYTGVSQILGVPLWLSCSHGRDLVASDTDIVSDAGIDREFFYRELRSLLFSHCPRTLHVDNPGKKGKSKGRSGETSNLSVNLYHFAELRGQACTSLTTGTLDVAALLEDLG